MLYVIAREEVGSSDFIPTGEVFDDSNGPVQAHLDILKAIDPDSTCYSATLLV